MHICLAPSARRVLELPLLWAHAEHPQLGPGHQAAGPVLDSQPPGFRAFSVSQVACSTGWVQGTSELACHRRGPLSPAPVTLLPAPPKTERVTSRNKKTQPRGAPDTPTSGPAASTPGVSPSPAQASGGLPVTGPDETRTLSSGAALADRCASSAHPGTPR